MKHTDQLLALAGKMKPCQCDPPGSGCAPCGLHMQGKEHSPECEGGCKDGEVPRYPTLRRVCPNCQQGLVKCYIDGKHVGAQLCDNCQGRVWAVVDDTDATLEAVRAMPHPRGRVVRDVLDELEDWLMTSPNDRTDTPNEVLVKALWRADKEAK